jgi:pyruvate-formate lyase-activating enzyme
MKQPFLLFSTSNGKIYSHPYLRMAASSFGRNLTIAEKELMQMPKGSSLFYLPGRLPVGFNPETGVLEVLENFEGEKVYAVSAFTIPAILRLYNPAAFSVKPKILPLWAYTACGFYAGKYYIAAMRIDKRVRQSPRFYNSAIIKNNIIKTIKRYPKNRLYRHLSHCALNYNCLAAKNLFMNRWEAPLPTAKFCNARCLGCLSDQQSKCVASHGRISFSPTVKEIYQVTTNHLLSAREAIVSFGQGCEGEPLMHADTIVKAISEIRAKTPKGTINMNTNASIPDKIKMLSLAGMDSFRVSINSVEEKYYNLYFRPRGYSFKDVMRSIEVAKRLKKFVSINLLVFPGFTDSLQQSKKLITFIKNTGIDMIQWRNLNIDPQYYLDNFPNKNFTSQGVLNLINQVRKKFPRLKFGYFNLPKEEFKA